MKGTIESITFDLVYKSGDTIRLIVFGKLATKFHPLIREESVYLIEQF